jgi:hypothetical protein
MSSSRAECTFSGLAYQHHKQKDLSAIFIAVCRVERRAANGLHLRLRALRRIWASSHVKKRSICKLDHQPHECKLAWLCKL